MVKLVVLAHKMSVFSPDLKRSYKVPYQAQSTDVVDPHALPPSSLRSNLAFSNLTAIIRLHCIASSPPALSPLPIRHLSRPRSGRLCVLVFSAHSC